MMLDGIIKGTGDSRYLKSVSDFLARYPSYADFAAALIAGTLPVDFNGINTEGWQKAGTPLNKANLLSDATAGKYGLSDANAMPDRVFEALSNFILSTGVVAVVVKDADGTPLQGVRIDGALSTSGAAVTTDAQGKAQIVITATVQLTFRCDYEDIPDYTVSVSPNYSQITTLNISMPYAAAGSQLLLKDSKNIVFRKSRTISVALVGGGQGGQGGYSGVGGQGGGAGGVGGKVINATCDMTGDNQYQLIIGAGGNGGNGASSSSMYAGSTGATGGNTTFNGLSSGSGSPNILVFNSSSALAGGTGGSGGRGGYYNNETGDANSASKRDASPGSSGTKCGGIGGSGGYPYGGTGDSGGTGAQPGGGGGGGGGGGHYWQYQSGGSDGNGGTGGAGGAGGLFIKF